MPYIKAMFRDALDSGEDTPHNAGELNYVITRVIADYLFEHGLSYQRLNDVIGVLECSKQELYRRIAGPYEDTKVAENGDVYPAEMR